MQLKQLIQVIFTFTMVGATMATPYLRRADCQCAVCDVGPGDCQGDDLKAYNDCVAVTNGECGRSCLDLAPGTGAQDGCLAAEISIQKPCENACVQRQLKNAYCADNPDGKFC